MSENTEHHLVKTNYKVAKKHYKKQVKRFEDVLMKRIKHQLKSQMLTELPQHKLSTKQLNELADIAMEKLLPTASQITISQLKVKPSAMSFALVPHKASPCRKCPAKAGGLCSCAIKANDRQKTG